MFAAPARAEETPCCNKVSSAAPLPRPPPRAAAAPAPPPPRGPRRGGRPLPPPPRRPWSTSPSSPRLAGRRGAPRCRRKVTPRGAQRSPAPPFPCGRGDTGRSPGGWGPAGAPPGGCEELSAASARPRASRGSGDALGLHPPGSGGPRFGARCCPGRLGALLGLICAVSSGAGRGVRAAPAGKLRQEGGRAPGSPTAPRGPAPRVPSAPPRGFVGGRCSSSWPGKLPGPGGANVGTGPVPSGELLPHGLPTPGLGPWPAWRGAQPGQDPAPGAALEPSRCPWGTGWAGAAPLPQFPPAPPMGTAGTAPRGGRSVPIGLWPPGHSSRPMRCGSCLEAGKRTGVSPAPSRRPRPHGHPRVGPCPPGWDSGDRPGPAAVPGLSPALAVGSPVTQGGPRRSLVGCDVPAEGLWVLTEHSCHRHCPGTAAWQGRKGGRVGVGV